MMQIAEMPTNARRPKQIIAPPQYWKSGMFFFGLRGKVGVGETWIAIGLPEAKIVAVAEGGTLIYIFVVVALLRACEFDGFLHELRN